MAIVNTFYKRSGESELQRRTINPVRRSFPQGRCSKISLAGTKAVLPGERRTQTAYQHRRSDVYCTRQHRANHIHCCLSSQQHRKHGFQRAMDAYYGFWMQSGSLTWIEGEGRAVRTRLLLTYKHKSLAE